MVEAFEAARAAVSHLFTTALPDPLVEGLAGFLGRLRLSGGPRRRGGRRSWRRRQGRARGCQRPRAWVCHLTRGCWRSCAVGPEAGSSADRRPWSGSGTPWRRSRGGWAYRFSPNGYRETSHEDASGCACHPLAGLPLENAWFTSAFAPHLPCQVDVTASADGATRGGFRRLGRGRRPAPRSRGQYEELELRGEVHGSFTNVSTHAVTPSVGIRRIPPWTASW